MSVIRTKRRNHYTTLSNEIVRSTDLSLKAKGLLMLMLSYPDDWDFNLAHLANQSRDGLHATRTAFLELAEVGYVSRTQRRDELGRVAGWDYEVRDEPTAVRFSDDGKANVGESHATKTERPTKTENHEEDQDLKPLSTSLTRAHPHTAFLDAWNEHRGNLPSVRTLDAKRKRSIDTLQKEHGTDALGLFEDAVACVAHADFWVERQYTIDNLMRAGRVLEKAEKWRAGAVQLGTANLRMATQVERWKRALDARHERPVN